MSLRFHDCDKISLTEFNHDNQITELSFAFLNRGFYLDGETPLPPFIQVMFYQGHGVSLSFRCFRVSAV